MTWRPKDWEIPNDIGKDNMYYRGAYEAGADAMHHADVKWLIQRIAYNGKNYVFSMNDKEWQEFIDV